MCISWGHTSARKAYYNGNRRRHVRLKPDRAKTYRTQWQPVITGKTRLLSYTFFLAPLPLLLITCGGKRFPSKGKPEKSNMTIDDFHCYKYAVYRYIGSIFSRVNEVFCLWTHIH